MSQEKNNAKWHIEALQLKKAKNDDNSTSLAHTLDTNIHTVNHKFVYELLQNADDIKAQAVTFFLDIDEKCLVVSHTGAHFTDEDVIRICDYARPGIGKPTDIEKTGYKGIGFKAVFGISSKVSVYSLEYRFCFDKGAFDSTLEAAYPWQIIPLYIDNFDVFAHTEYVGDPAQLDGAKPFEDCVHFVLENIDVEKVQRELREIFGSSEVLMCLRHTQFIQLSYADNRYGTSEIFRKDNLEDNTVELLYTSPKNCNKRVWKTYEDEIRIPDEKRVFIEQLSDVECPQKLKQAKKVKVLFAAEVSSDGTLIAQGDNTRLFCYLPTSVKMGLPFWLNTDFSLDSARAQLINNVWNATLLEAIGKKQFEWFAKLAQDESVLIQDSMLSLLHLLDKESLKAFGFPKRLRRAYEKGFIQGVKSVKFIPNHLSHELLALQEVTLDFTGFFEQFAHDILNRYDWIHSLVSYRIADYYKALIYLGEVVFNGSGVVVYEWRNLFKDIEKYCLSFSDNQSKLEEILYFFKEHLTDSDQIKHLKSKKILKTNKGFQSADCVYVPSQDEEILYWVEVLNIDVNYLLLTSLELIEWLQDALSVREMSRAIIVREHLPLKIKNNEILKHNSKAFFQLIYNTYLAGEIDKGDLKSLGKNNFPMVAHQLKSDNKWKSFLRPVRACFYYATDEEKTKVERGLYYIFSHFYTSEFDIVLLKEIVLAMEIKTKITLLELQGYYTKIYKKLEIINSEDAHIFADYYRHYRAKIPGLRNTECENDYFSNFITFEFLKEFLEHNASYADFFWRAVEERSDQLLKKTIFKRNNKKRGEFPQYLTFYFKEKREPWVAIRGQKNRYAFPHELFAPHLIDQFGELSLPFADIPPISPEIAELFGFKIQLSFQDCLGLLKEGLFDIDLLRMIYRELIRTYDGSLPMDSINLKLLDKEKHLISKWELRMDDIPQKFNNSNAGIRLFNSCKLGHDDLLRLSSIFGIGLLSQEKSTFIAGSKEESDRHYSHITDFVIQYLPLLVIVERSLSSVKADSFLESLWKRFKALAFKYGETRFGGYQVKVFIQEGNLYFDAKARKASIDKYNHELVKELSCYFGLSESVGEKWVKYCDKFELFFEDIEEFDCGEEEFDRLARVLETLTDIPVQNREVDSDFHYEESISSAESDERLIVTPKHAVHTLQPIQTQVLENPVVAKNFSTPTKLEKQITLISEAPKTGSNKKPQIGGSSFFSGKKKHKPSAAKKLSFDQVNENLFNPGYLEQQDKQQLQVIGEKGERYVFNYLKDLLTDQLGVEPTENNDSLSFVVSDNKIIDLVWHLNYLEPDEKQGQTDLTILLNGEVLYYIEVKSTKEKDSSTFFLSDGEWELMRQKREKYILVRVYDVESINPRILGRKDPFGMIIEGLIAPNNAGYASCSNRLEFKTENKSMTQYEVMGWGDPNIGCRIS